MHRGGTLGAHTILDVSRPHTHSKQGDAKDKVLHQCATAKYRKHRQAYKAIGFDSCPFAGDTLGRMHHDAVRVVWHLARQAARTFLRRGWEAGGRHRPDLPRESARQIRFLLLACTTLSAADGIRQRFPTSASADVPRSGGHHARLTRTGGVAPSPTAGGP